MEQYLSPDDKHALLDVLGPLYQESKQIDQSWFNDSRGAEGGVVKQGIAQELKNVLERELRSPALPPPAHSYSPYSQHVPFPQPTYGEPTQHAAPLVPNFVPEEKDQLEFNFNQSTQEKTNNLLEEISRKLTKLISLIESNQKTDENVTKLKVRKSEV